VSERLSDMATTRRHREEQAHTKADWHARAAECRNVAPLLGPESRKRVLALAAEYDRRAGAKEANGSHGVPSIEQFEHSRRSASDAVVFDAHTAPHANEEPNRLAGAASQWPVRNRLLQRLPAAELDRLLARAERVPLHPRQILHHWNMPLREVYFVEQGLVSVSVKIGRERAVEGWLIGSEGMSGIPVLFGDHDHPPFRRVVQVGGSAWRISADGLAASVRELDTLRELLQRYAEFVLCQTSLCGACNAQHSVKERLGRWLLTACDRLESNRLPATHTLLASLLGVRRASVSECLNIMRAEGAIRNTPRLVEVVNPEMLRSISCDCHSIIQRDYRRLFASRSFAVPAAALA